jgi:SAM-dependent methyltransferase
MTPLDCHDLYADAEFYDLEFAARDAEIPFFRRHASRAAGPVLEIACGTGRLTLPIARDGVDITGLDVSRPMLEQARRKSAAANLPVAWVEQDCRELHLERTFALIFSATNAMQHLLDFASVGAFLRSAARALQPGGQLIIDVFNPDVAQLARTPATRYPHKSFMTTQGATLRVEVASEYHADTQVLHFDLFYLGDGQLLRTKRVNMRCFFPEELLALCRLNGLEITRRYGDYDEGEFTSTSPKQILFCQPDGPVR